MTLKVNFNLLVVCVLCSLTAYSQTNIPNPIYQTYDNLVGKDNTSLYNGTEFTDLFLNTDGTYRYFNAYDYTKGTLNYNGEYYVNVLLKYDLLEDKLLTQSDDNLSVFNVNLIPDFVDAFSIYEHKFVRLTDVDLNIALNGFFEEVYLGDTLNLYIKHTKKKKDIAKNSGIQYKFSNHNYFIVKFNGNYSIVDSSKDLRKLLPDKADEINAFYKTHKALNKSNPEVFMAKLIKNIDGLVTKNNQQ